MRGVSRLEEIHEVAFSDGEALTKNLISKVENVRVPDHRSAAVNAIHQLLSDQRFLANPLAFSDELPGDDLPKAIDFKLRWGTEKQFFFCFVYNKDKQIYLWFSNKVPRRNWTDAIRTEEVELTFANVIVQHVSFSYPATLLLAETDLSAGGRAQIAMGGRLIEAQWINRAGSIHYVDSNGNDIPLLRGKTYIAIWPDDDEEISWK